MYASARLDDKLSLGAWPTSLAGFAGVQWTERPLCICGRVKKLAKDTVVTSQEAHIPVHIWACAWIPFSGRTPHVWHLPGPHCAERGLSQKTRWEQILSSSLREPLQDVECSSHWQDMPLNHLQSAYYKHRHRVEPHATLHDPNVHTCGLLAVRSREAGGLRFWQKTFEGHVSTVASQGQQMMLVWKLMN